MNSRVRIEEVIYVHEERIRRLNSLLFGLTEAKYNWEEETEEQRLGVLHCIAHIEKQLVYLPTEEDK